MKYIFDTHGADSDLNDRSGQLVEVIRSITADEADIKDVGQMFEVEFPDGYRTWAFEDELESV